MFASRPTLFAAAREFVDRRPGPRCRLVIRQATFLVAFLDMLSLTLLLACVGGFVAAWHRTAFGYEVGRTGCLSFARSVISGTLASAIDKGQSRFAAAAIS